MSCVKGKRTNSTACRTKLGVETELFECWHSTESKEHQKKIIDRIQELKKECTLSAIELVTLDRN